MRHTLDDILLQLADLLAGLALQEDVGRGDLTGEALLGADTRGRAELRIKQDGVLCGVEWLGIIMARLDPDAQVTLHAADGDRLRAGTLAAEVTATHRALVAGERTALNLIQRLSGVATLTARFTDALEGTRAMVFDTRKTTPGLRAFEKYAVRCGGGGNHRMGLYDELMIKENHLRLSGLDLPTAIERLRAAHPDTRLTAEAETVAEAQAAIRSGADIVMLDDFSLEDIRTVVEYRGLEDDAVRRTQLEVSGGVTLETVREYGEAGVERISVGALTHSATALDMALKVL
jgi:nicotinate-nucleotide pyrophosphorylase (carboxylating)